VISRLPPRTVAALGFAAALAHGSCAAATLLSTNLPPAAPAAPAVPEVTGSLLRIGGALVIVLAVFFAGVWFFQNWGRFAGQRNRSQRLQVLEVRALGNRHALFVVGYDQQRLLIASSPTGLSLLERLPAAAASDPTPAPEPPASFGDTLRRLANPR